MKARLTWDLAAAVIAFAVACLWFVFMIIAVADDRWVEAIFWLLLLAFTGRRK